MNYKNFLILLFVILPNCTTYDLSGEKEIVIQKNYFNNKGFTLIYNDNLRKQKIITNKIDERSLVIFQKNLKKNTTVKLKNISNNKTIIAKVGPKSNYPLFNNSVISLRIAKELDLNLNEPYIEITEILDSDAFIAKKAKMFDEEKNVANKAPIESISINNLNESTEVIKIKKKTKFNYIIKVADFYFKDTALEMISRIKRETETKSISFAKLSKTQFRVFLGPFNSLKSLQKAFNDISILEFENIEIVKK